MRTQLSRKESTECCLEFEQAEIHEISMDFWLVLNNLLYFG